jgi:hypothetical protein
VDVIEYVNNNYYILMCEYSMWTHVTTSALPVAVLEVVTIVYVLSHMASTSEMPGAVKQNWTRHV